MAEGEPEAEADSLALSWAALRAAQATRQRPRIAYTFHRAMAISSLSLKLRSTRGAVRTSELLRVESPNELAASVATCCLATDCFPPHTAPHPQRRSPSIVASTTLEMLSQESRLLFHAHPTTPNLGGAGMRDFRLLPLFYSIVQIISESVVLKTLAAWHVVLH